MTDNHNAITGNQDPTPGNPVPITTQPEPLHLGRAAQALDAVLAGDLDVETRLAVGAALAVLADVHPPYPPLPEPAQPMPVVEGIALAVAELAAAVEHAGSVEEAIRAGLAARELRRIGARP